MKKGSLGIVLGALLALGVAPRARATDGSTFVATPNTGDSLFGYHIYGTESNPRGVSLDYNDTTNPGSLGWSLGLERTYGDFYLFNYHYVNSGTLTASNQSLLDMRGDTGQTVLGPGATHQASASAAQLQILAGGASAARNGLEVDIWGTQWHSLDLEQKDGVTHRTRINMNGAWRIGTDTAAAPGNTNQDWYLQNTNPMGGGLPIVVSYANSLTTINNGLQVAGQLQHTGSTLSFYGATPIAKQTVTGCRSDGTALASMLTALKNLGLINDQTTP